MRFDFFRGAEWEDEAEFSLSDGMEDGVVRAADFEFDVIEEGAGEADFASDGILSPLFKVVGAEGSVKFHIFHFLDMDTSFGVKAFHRKLCVAFENEAIACEVSKSGIIKGAGFSTDGKVAAESKVPHFAKGFEAEGILVEFLVTGFSVVVVGIDAVDKGGTEETQSHADISGNSSAVKNVKAGVYERHAKGG